MYSIFMCLKTQFKNIIGTIHYYINNNQTIEIDT